MKKLLLASSLVSLTLPNVSAAEIPGPCDPKTTSVTVWAACVNKYLGELQAQMGKPAAANQQTHSAEEIQGPCEPKMAGTITAWAACMNKHLGDLQAENQALKTQLEQLSQQQPNQTLPATTENCTAEQTGQIHFDGTYARLCNGTHWQVIEARHPKPVLKPSAKKYTMAEVRATAKGKDGKNPERYGQGTICETGYHICIFMEALVLKYAYPRSRIPYEGDTYLRTLGNYSYADHAGSTHPHNSLLGYKSSSAWNGPSLQCPNGSGPMIHFYNRDSRNKGVEWDGGCYKDDKRFWACCINNLD